MNLFWARWRVDFVSLAGREEFLDIVVIVQWLRGSFETSWGLFGGVNPRIKLRTNSGLLLALRIGHVDQSRRSRQEIAGASVASSILHRLKKLFHIGNVGYLTVLAWRVFGPTGLVVVHGGCVLFNLSVV